MNILRMLLVLTVLAALFAGTSMAGARALLSF